MTIAIEPAIVDRESTTLLAELVRQLENSGYVDRHGHRIENNVVYRKARAHLGLELPPLGGRA